MENAIKFSVLLELYGGLLTEKQYELLDDYYNQDLGLSEIAENLGITRQAVRDNLKKGENNLVQFDEKLGLLEKTQTQKQKLDKICDEMEELKKNLDNEQKDKLTKIMQKLKEFN